MALSSDNVKTIGLIADKLEKWAENLSYSVSPTENLWVELTLSLYPQDVQGIASWLANILSKSQIIRNEFDDFSKLVQEIDAWRNQGVYPEDLGEFCAHINRLMKITRNIISILRRLSDPGKPEPPETKVDDMEKPNVPEKQQINPASTKPGCTLDQTLSEEALMAYKLHCETGLTIQQAAKRMTAELKLDKALRPWQISRWVKQVESRQKRTRIPIRSIAPKRSGTMERHSQIDTTAQTDTKDK